MTHLKLQKLQKGDYPQAHRLNVNVLSFPHGRDASRKIWCRYLYPILSYWHFFPKLKMAAAAILDLVGEPWDHPRRRIRGAYSRWKFRHDRLSSFRVIRIWIFVVQAWKSYSRPKNFIFWLVIPPKFGEYCSDPQKAHSCAISHLLSDRA